MNLSKQAEYLTMAAVVSKQTQFKNTNIQTSVVYTSDACIFLYVLKLQGTVDKQVQ